MHALPDLSEVSRLLLKHYHKMLSGIQEKFVLLLSQFLFEFCFFLSDELRFNVW